MAIARRDVVSAPAMTTFLFQRALTHGRVFHSKRYGRIHQRNSYTVIFQDEGTAWVYLALVNRLYLTDEPVEASDGSVKATLQHIVKAYPAVYVGPDVIHYAVWKPVINSFITIVTLGLLLIMMLMI